MSDRSVIPGREQVLRVVGVLLATANLRPDIASIGRVLSELQTAFARPDRNPGP